MDSEYSEVARKRLELMCIGPSVGPPHGVILRRGQREDYEGIKQLTRKAMKGVDFMVSYYLQYMEDPDRFVYVAEKDGKIIGSIMHYVVDGGRTVYMGGARRDPAYKGQTVFKGLFYKAFLWTLIARPEIEKSRGSSFHIEFNKDRIKSSRFSRIIPGSFKYYVTMARSVPNKDVRDSINSRQLDSNFLKHNVKREDVNFASKDDLERIFTNDSLKQRVFPGDCLQAGMEVFEPRVENLKALFKDDREFAISKNELSVSVFQFWHSETGSVFTMKLHGEASAEIAMAHFLRLAERFSKHSSAEKCLSVLYAMPKVIPKVRVVELCRLLPFYQKGDNIFDEMMSTETFIPPLHHL